MKKGTRAYFNYESSRACGVLRLTKEVDGKLYRLDVDNLPWIQTSPYSYIEGVPVDEFTDGRVEGEKGNLHGENLALKSEVKFLREQVAKLLEKM